MIEKKDRQKPPEEEHPEDISAVYISYRDPGSGLRPVHSNIISRRGRTWKSAHALLNWQKKKE